LLFTAIICEEMSKQKYAPRSKAVRDQQFEAFLQEACIRKA